MDDWPPCPVRVVNLRHKPWPLMIYVGREWAGLDAHPLGNPFKGPDALARYRAWLLGLPDRDKLLAELWADTECGRLPLACWCCDWCEGEPPAACHAVVVAQELVRTYRR